MTPIPDLCEKLEALEKALRYVSPVCNGLHDTGWRNMQAEALRQAISLLRRDGMVYQDEIAPLISIVTEHGYKCCEQGMSLEAALDKTETMLKAAKEEK